MSEPAATSELTSGNITTRATGPASTRRTSRLPVSPRAFPASPMGSPSASPRGVTADSTAAWTAPGQNSDERYAATAPHVA